MSHAPTPTIHSLTIQSKLILVINVQCNVANTKIARRQSFAASFSSIASAQRPVQANNYIQLEPIQPIARFFPLLLQLTLLPSGAYWKVN